MRNDLNLSFDALRAGYAAGLSPAKVAVAVLERIASTRHANAWIYVEDRNRLIDSCEALARRSPRSLPLFGIPFAVKDNIDVAGMPTTAGCPDFMYVPSRSARAVELLLEAGGICIGKTNLDQFATGLSGARSPYGTCASVGNPLYVSGGSSSGSAIAVAAGHVAFSLGTDTGGSGRIPAGFNGIVGVKPTVGRVSTRGLVPNCQSLDCVSVFSNTVGEGGQVLDILTSRDDDDPFSRATPPRQQKVRTPFAFGRLAPQTVECFDMPECLEVYEQSCRRLVEIGGQPVAVDASPLIEAGQMLFNGPWIAERRLAIDSFGIAPSSMLDVTRDVLVAADRYSAADAFRGAHRLAALRQNVERLFSNICFLAVPTAPRPFTVSEMNADPVMLNNRIGHYSYGANLLDLCALAVPGGVLSNGVPMGITMLAPAWCDEVLAQFGAMLEARSDTEPKSCAAAATGRTPCRDIKRLTLL